MKSAWYRRSVLASAILAAALLAVRAVPASSGYAALAFSDLIGFEYRAPGSESFAPVKPAPGRKDGIPLEVRELDGRRVRIQGFMLPMAVDKAGFATELLVMRDVQTCCYGATPQPTEWIVAKLGPKSPKVKPLMDTPLFFFGTLHVGELYRDQQFAGIYELEIDKVAKP